MGDKLEQITVSKNIEAKTTRQANPKTLLLYVFSLIYLLIPFLSTESFVCWSIGIIGVYKTVKLYRNNDEKKELKSLKHLLISIAIAVIFNVLIYYITKILIEKFA